MKNSNTLQSRYTVYISTWPEVSAVMVLAGVCWVALQNTVLCSGNGVKQHRLAGCHVVKLDCYMQFTDINFVDRLVLKFTWDAFLLLNWWNYTGLKLARCHCFKMWSTKSDNREQPGSETANKLWLFVVHCSFSHQEEQRKVTLLTDVTNLQAHAGLLTRLNTLNIDIIMYESMLRSNVERSYQP